MPHSTRVFWTIDLADPLATAPDRTGAKAANLARAARHDLPVLPGFVIPVQCTAADRRHRDTGELRAAWARLSQNSKRPLVVRSSATDEDGATSSMAGRFVSVLDVRDWAAFVRAVREVTASASRPGTMAVLVQPQLEAVSGGVMFGADPVDGRTDRVIVSAVAGGPQALVGGEADGTRYALTRRGRPVGGDGPGGPLTRARLRELARLAARAAAVFGGPQDIEFAFDAQGRLWLLQSRPVTALAPVAPRRAPLLGPGPVAETLPDPLSPLEEDLWLAPLDRGLGEALAFAGTVSRRALRRNPTVRPVDGRAAADLDRLGAAPGRPSRLRLLDPVPPARRLAAAWRVGRLRADLPALAASTAAAVDADLAAVPPLAELDDADLIAALHWTRATLAALHGLESLAGALLPPGEGEASAAERGLAALARGVDEPLPDPSVLALTPPAVAPLPHLPAPLPSTGAPPLTAQPLTAPPPATSPSTLPSRATSTPTPSPTSPSKPPPRVTAPHTSPATSTPTPHAASPSVLPPCATSTPTAPSPATSTRTSPAASPSSSLDARRAGPDAPVPVRPERPETTRRRPDPPASPSVPARRAHEARELPARELLRLRIRWVQELGARVAWAAGLRLAASGALERPEPVRALRLDELETVLLGGALPAELERRPAPPRSAPLPAAFRLAGERIVAESPPPGDGARPAGGGRGSGPVHSGPGAPPPGAVLVVDILAPSLAAWLPRLSGVVSETGSPLSHLAILARELGVPAVVGLRGALDRFPPGTEVLVDGGTGRVEVLRDAAESRAGEESVA
ncbi:PEP/pyruvate-binding domain-containing protein [Spirillospora sp. CA-253888]